MLELNQLYLMDCMEGMREFPDGYFELAIVDPPYGTGAITYMPGERLSGVGGFIDKYEVSIATFGAATSVRGQSKRDVVHDSVSAKTLRHFGDFNSAPAPAYFHQLFRVAKNQVIFGGNYFFLPPTRGFMIYQKQVAFNFSMAMCEYIWTSFDTNAKIFRYNQVGKPSERIHPTQKPVGLYKELIKHLARPGDKILDTHVGSGSSLIAAREMGHAYVGFEIDSEYHAVASKRIAMAEKQKMLFQAEQRRQQLRLCDDRG